MSDDRLHKALEFANYRQTFFNQKQILKNRGLAEKVGCDKNKCVKKKQWPKS